VPHYKSLGICPGDGRSCPTEERGVRQVTRKADTLSRRIAAAILASLCALAGAANAADLEPKTIAAFDSYVRATEARINSERATRERFLWIDTLPDDRRAALYQQLRAGQVVIERLDALNPGNGSEPMAVPGGMIHDWIGTVFVPGATLAQTLALEQDYDHHQDYFQPEVMRSKILRHDGNDFVIALRLRKKKIITAVLDTEHEVHYSPVDATHASSRSHTTRIQEVENPGEESERLLPVGHDQGFLWRMNTYWRFEEKSGGTYVECQSVSLTRDIPEGLGWMIGPIVTSVPRESLTFMLATTRGAVLERIGVRSFR
jgi:hypothetical protein